MILSFRFHNEIFQIVKEIKKNNNSGYWEKASPVPMRLDKVKGNKIKGMKNSHNISSGKRQYVYHQGNKDRSECQVAK